MIIYIVIITYSMNIRRRYILVINREEEKMINNIIW